MDRYRRIVPEIFCRQPSASVFEEALLQIGFSSRIRLRSLGDTADDVNIIRYNPYQSVFALWSSSGCAKHSPLGRRLVRAAGLEPALPCEKRILSPLRLPLRHARTIRRS